MAVCPFADQSKRYDGSYPGGYVSGFAPRGVLHTTETTGLPDYAGGSVAPQFTVDPLTGHIWQHFDSARPGRALKHPPGTIDTNNAGARQIEIIAYSDATIAARVGGLRIDRLTPAQLAPIAKLMRWIEATDGVQSASGLTFKAYPGSAGVSNGVRMSSSAWQAFRGWCGHTHVPNNDHGDPSDIAITALLSQVAPTPPEDDLPYTEQQLQAAAGTGVLGAQIGHTGLTVGVVLDRLYGAATAETVQIAALTAAVQALASSQGLDQAAVLATVEQATKAALADLSITLTTAKVA